ncbi:MAG: arylamine N-acetyltransferase [Chloroflexi bacterium]|nr:arylamine N-acetyltransferase [Chloroflexota bacterium]
MMFDSRPAFAAGRPQPLSDAHTDRYLALLGLDGGPPSRHQLAALVRAHVLRVPFENVTALLRRRDHPTGPAPQPDSDALLTAWEGRAGGGVCFEIAMMVSRLLATLGYGAHLVLGQISLPFGHQAVVVEVGGRRYLVDLGNGAPIFEPLPLDGQPVEVHRHGLSFRFRHGDEPDALFQDRMIDGAWKQHCRYSLAPAADADRDAGYQHHHTPNASWVTGSLTMVRSTDTEVYSLKDAVLTRHTEHGKSADTLPDEAAYQRMAAEVYGLPALRIGDALAVRAAFSQLGAGSTTTRR